MSNIDKYASVFKTSFEITDEQLEGLEYQGIKEWDSVGHMQLMAELEDTFSIELDTDDIIDFSSYEKGKVILKKYKVEI